MNVVEEFLKDYSYDEVSHYKPKENDILIINSCCANKDVSEGLLPANIRYKGMEIRHISSLYKEYNMKFDHYIISAKYGLIPADTMIPYYNKTFNHYKKSELKQIAPYLHIREDVENLIRKNNYKLVIILLGDMYLNILDIDKPFEVDSMIFSFSLDKHKTIQAKNELIVPLKVKEYIKKFKHYGCICLKSGIIKELFLKYPNYEFLDNFDLIEKFITE